MNPDDVENFDIDIGELSTFKFHIRRASFLDNYLILESKFLEKLANWFIKIDNYLKQSKKSKQHDELRIKKLRSFPIFVLGSYTEMVQRNGWVAHRILEKMREVGNFEKSGQGRQFLRMMIIEAASVIDDFMKMMEKDYSFYNANTIKNCEKELNTNIDNVKKGFLEKKEELNKTNKYSIVRDIFLVKDQKIEDPILMNKFFSYLWIKQLLHADSNDEIKEINYQGKIDAIIKKMKELFSDTGDAKRVRAFFIATDGQPKPHVLAHEGGVLNEFNDEFENAKNNEQIDDFKTQIIIDFLTGNPQNIQTTAEFISENGDWKNIYTDDHVSCGFIPQGYQWLYLIRISKLKEYEKGKYEFEPQGLLGFYSKENLEKNIFTKQLLMLLRKDMSAFIDKHHKNDEFAGLILQKEEANSQFMLRHSLSEYEKASKYYFGKICDLIDSNDDEFEKLKKYYQCAYRHLTNKLSLIKKLGKFNPDNPDNFETFKLQKIVDVFKDNFDFILKYKRDGLYYLDEDDDCNVYIELSDIDLINNEILNYEINFPVALCEEMIFELIYNIRKHILNVYSLYIKSDKLKMELDFVEERDTLYFKISNNYCSKTEDYFNRIHSNEKDGLSLINYILKKAKIGKIKVKITESAELKDRIIGIYIPLKHLKR